jgi:predicted  nucleic acid-binding Zn-ribbon protein
MKTYVFPLIAVILIYSCNQETAEHNKYVNRLDSLNLLINERDSTINDLFASFDEIKTNLDSVSLKQNMISTEVEKQQGEVKDDAKTHINNQIAAINNLMDQNKKKIEELNGKLKKYSIRINHFQKMVNSLNEEIAQKTNELQSLNEKLSSANAQLAKLQTAIDTLTNTSTSQSKLITEQTTALHTAYYLIGKSKDLQSMDVIDKTGGILGIGKTPKLNSDANKSNFTKIDYTKVLSIPINSKKAKIITNHPSGSYILDKDEKDQYSTLRITEPESFWSESKYLVVAI